MTRPSHSAAIAASSRARHPVPRSRSQMAFAFSFEIDIINSPARAEITAFFDLSPYGCLAGTLALRCRSPDFQALDEARNTTFRPPKQISDPIAKWGNPGPRMARGMGHRPEPLRRLPAQPQGRVGRGQARSPVARDAFERSGPPPPTRLGWAMIPIILIPGLDCTAGLFASQVGAL